MTATANASQDDKAVPLLTIENVSAGYDRIRVLQGLSLQVRTGSVTALLGSNGVGKTTLMRAIVGLIPLSAGEILWRGISITQAPSHERVAKGIVLVPEGRQLFPDFSVEENLKLGAFGSHVRAAASSRMQEIFELFPKLADRRRQQARDMSGGEQQMLALARGLMANPSLLLLDEPSLGLSPMATQHLFHLIKRIRSMDVTIFIVEQNVQITLDIADYAYVIEQGRVRLEGEGQIIAGNPQIKKAYLGL